MTYIGIAKMVLAYFLSDYASQEEVDGVVDGTLQSVSTVLGVMGIVEAIYGRYRIKRAAYAA